MLLFIVGPINPEAIMNQVRENQSKKEYKDQPEIKRQFDEEPPHAAEKKQVLEMNVQTSKCLVGIKALHVDQSGEKMLKNELTMNILLDILFGKSSENYDQLYKEGLVDETFSSDYTQELGFGFAMIGGDTRDADKLADTLKKMLFEAKNGSPITEEKLEGAKRKKIGAFLRAINSPEYIANQFTRYAFNEMNLFDVVPTLEGITLKDVQALAAEVISEERFSVCQVVPKKN
jgi:predicted Zn-dependent peptidase